MITQNQKYSRCEESLEKAFQQWKENKSDSTRNVFIEEAIYLIKTQILNGFFKGNENSEREGVVSKNDFVNDCVIEIIEFMPKIEKSGFEKGKLHCLILSKIRNFVFKKSRCDKVIKINVYLCEQIRNYKKELAKLDSSELNDEEKIEISLKRSNVKKSLIQSFCDLSSGEFINHTSLDSGFGDKETPGRLGEKSLICNRTARTEITEKESSMVLGKIIDSLSDSEKYIVNMLFGINGHEVVPGYKIAKKIKISYSKFQNIEESILKKIKNRYLIY
jgi:DNA-directed RNA polymerase specialized sigma subunit